MSNYIQVKARTAAKWTTHMPALLQTLAVSTGTVLEVGAGLYSTPLLHWICKRDNRKLITYENEPLFYEFARDFNTDLHEIRFIEDWDLMDFKSHYGLVFIDHHPEARRATEVLNFKDSADFIVVHDTDRSTKYGGLNEVFKQFKHQTTWDERKPHTTVVSDE